MNNEHYLNIDNSISKEEIIESTYKKKSHKWLYMVISFLAISISVFILTYIGLETVHQADREIVTGVDKNSNVSENSELFKNVLDEIRSGKDINYCIAKLAPIKDNINAKRLINGIETYSELKAHVRTENEIHYEDLREKISPFLYEVRSNYDISPDTLYFSYIARDIILYIFIHKEVFMIHDSDSSIMGKDGRSLVAFYQDAFTVYNQLKQIELYRIKETERFWKDADNANLFITAIYCQSRWATAGFNNSGDITALFHLLESNRFSLSGHQGSWLQWLENEIKAVKDNILKTSLGRRRPDFVSTTWLK
jgi:hypothetical protein